MAGGGANSGRRDGPGDAVLRSGGRRLLLPRASFAGQGAGRALALVLAHLSHGSFPLFTPLSPSSSGAPKWRRWGTDHVSCGQGQ